MRPIHLLLLLICVIPFSASAQEDKGLLGKLENFEINHSVGVQIWSTYTMGQDIFNEVTGKYEAVDNRFNTQLRRSRISLKGKAYERIKFNFTAAVDAMGRDLLSGTEGPANNGPSPFIRIWNFFVQWQLIRESEDLYLTAGYFVPQIGRESITAGLRTGSMEKSWSQNYMRRHIVGTGPGRAMGINLGGILSSEEVNFHVGYDAGIFSPVFQSLNGNSTGINSTPMVSGRVALYFGDKESDSYTLGHKVNYLGKRKGLTLGVAATTQGETDLFTSNSAFGIDLLFNYGNLNLDGEWTWLQREGEFGNTSPFSVSSQTGYARIGYNLNLRNGYIIEPVVMWVAFLGETDEASQAYAASAGSLFGEEETIELGANLYFNPDLKLSLFYTLRNGDLGAADEGAQINNYYSQGGVGAIRRGNWVGLGLVAIF
ncbi:MAG: hypothetical protein GYB31_20315 [Bacteroidetes bacterium]|nr:hypothetical protein [Bacteroidota bacterium]